MMKRTLVVLMAGLISIVPVSPSFAGSGTDGVFEVRWKDWKKSKAKGCSRQKITIKLLENVDWSVPYRNASVDITLYNDDDEEIASAHSLWDKSSTSTGKLMFCDNLGPKPYYMNIKWTISPLSQLRKGEFEIPYKFKK